MIKDLDCTTSIEPGLTDQTVRQLTDKLEMFILILNCMYLILQCLGRVQTETLDVVYRMCENSQYLTIDCHLPFTSDVEKKAVELIQYICTELVCYFE
jgi:hypothetical protein